VYARTSLDARNQVILMALKPRARVIIAGLAAVLIASGAVVYYIQRRQRSRFVYSLGPADPAVPELARTHGYTVHELPIAAGARVRGLIRPAARPDAPFVLLFPGNTSQQLAANLPLVEALRAARAPAGAAVFAYRGFDGSTGLPSVPSAALDARAQLEHLRDNLGVSPERLVIAGYSMGSGIALRLATELAAAGQPPAAVLMLSPYWRLDLAPARALGILLPSETYVVDDVISKVTFPLLVVAGERDDALPVAHHAHPLMKALGKRAQYWELPGAGHQDYLEDRALLARVAAFAWSHLTP
jgi:pimeloyl-ACP methyl ester carboxylesterase